jgi:hypothetical protein
MSYLLLFLFLNALSASSEESNELHQNFNLPKEEHGKI